MELLQYLLVAIVYVSGRDAAVRNTQDFSNKVTHVVPGKSYWSPWSRWTPCSRTCGVGVTFRSRFCVDGYSRVDLSNCNGEPREHALCSQEPCPGDDVDFRAIQCSVYDEVDHYGVVRHWTPVPSINSNCDLICEKQVSSTETISRDMGLVIDGTQCTNRFGRGVCILGECRTLGCDGQLDSTLQFDNCGECGGRNLSCGELSGTFTIQLAEEELFHYYDVVAFQPGTSNITVEEASGVNYLALSVNDIYYINGNWDINRPGVFSTAGTTFTYERRRDGYEKISSPGPINTVVQISIIVRTIDPLVTYRFYLPSTPNQTPTTLANEDPANFGNTFTSNTAMIKESGRRPFIHDVGDSTGVEGNTGNKGRSANTVTTQPVIEKNKPGRNTPKKEKLKTKKKMKESCGPCEKAKGKLRNFCTSDFVVRAMVLDRTIVLDQYNMTRYDIEIHQTFTNHVMLFTREYIWVPNICHCPKMKTGREYLIMGDRVQSVNSRENLLMVDRNKMVVRWNPTKYGFWNSIQSTPNSKCSKLRSKYAKKKKTP